jgi:hypothetical protein
MCRYTEDPEGEVEINYGNQIDELHQNIHNIHDIQDNKGNNIKNEVVLIEKENLNDQIIPINDGILLSSSSLSSSSSSSSNKPIGQFFKEPSIEFSKEHSSIETSREHSSVETSREHSSVETSREYSPSKESSSKQPSTSTGISSSSSSSSSCINNDSKVNFLVVNTNLAKNPYALSPVFGGPVRQVVSSQGCSRNFIVKGKSIYEYLFICVFMF